LSWSAISFVFDFIFVALQQPHSLDKPSRLVQHTTSDRKQAFAEQVTQRCYLRNFSAVGVWAASHIHKPVITLLALTAFTVTAWALDSHWLLFRTFTATLSVSA
jgi:hypothetical protein